MALLQGGDLRAALDGPHGAQYLWCNLGAGIAADIACGLAYIHTTGVVHRCVQAEATSFQPCILHDVESRFTVKWSSHFGDIPYFILGACSAGSWSESTLELVASLTRRGLH